MNDGSAGHRKSSRKASAGPAAGPAARIGNGPVVRSGERGPRQVDISAYGDGLRIVPGGRTARLERDEDGRLVARADTEVTDETMFALIDSARR